MKKTLGLIILGGLFAFSFFIDTYTNQDTDIQFWSRVISFVLICITIIVLIKKYQVNVSKEIQTLFKYKTEPKAAKQSLRILLAGTVIPIFLSVFIFTPIITFGLIKINASDYHKSFLLKNHVIRTYHTGGGKKKFYVDSYYDGKNVTIRVSKEMEKQIDKNGQLPNLNRGRLGFYFIRE